MNWEAIGAIGEIIGAIAVVASLIYLAVQLRHNSRQMEYSARTTEVSAYHEITGRMVTNRQTMFADSELPNILVKARHGEELAEVEIRKYGAYVLSMLANAEAAHFQHSKGLLTDEHLDSLVQGLLRHVKNHKLGVTHWKAYRPEFVAPFQEYMDEKFRQNGIDLDANKDDV
jgi:hypothetical protein